MRGLKGQWRRARIWWRRIPLRTRLGVFVGAIAIAGLVWQHQSGLDEKTADQPTGQATTTAPADIDEGDDHDHDGHAIGEYQPDPSELLAPPDYTSEAAGVTAERFAANFASPNGNFDDWLARISPDVTAELQDQYRLTDIRNVPQTTVQSVTGPLNDLTATPVFQAAYSDGSRVEITVEMDIEGWKVTSVIPLDTPAPAPDPAAAPVPTPDPAAGPVPAPAAPPALEGRP